MTYGHSLFILLCFLSLSACQKDDLPNWENEENILNDQTIFVRSSNNVCSNILLNSNFNDVNCENGAIAFGNNCVENWVGCLGTADHISPNWSWGNTLPGQLTFTGPWWNNTTFTDDMAFLCVGVFGHTESIYQNVNINPDSDYCLNINYSATDWTEFDDQGDMFLYILLTNEIINSCDNNNSVENICTQAEYCEIINIPSTLIYPSTQNIQIELPEGTSADHLILMAYSDAGIMNSPNNVDGILVNEVNMSCESKQLVGIGNSKNGCTYTFWGEERPNSDIDIVSWAWDFGDGTTGTADDITHTYTEAGDYTVTLYIEDENGCCHTEQIEVNCEIIEADYCKYICHEEYLMPGFTCAVGVLYDHPSFVNPELLTFTQPYEHTDFVGIANEIETELNNLGYNMIVATDDPNGLVTCYKSICVGCDGNPLSPDLELDEGIPTGVVNGTVTGSTITGNGVLSGDIVIVAPGDTIFGNGYLLTTTISTTTNIDPNTITVVQNPNGPGFIIYYEETEGLFAMGDVEILRILGNNEFNGVNCDAANVLNGIPTMPFNYCP